jgi:hypothetical protein
MWYNQAYFLTSVGIDIWVTDKRFGGDIRLAADSTVLIHGETGTYIGNDNKIYNTICINGIEYTSENLKETRFRNGDYVPLVTSASAWIALTSAGICWYNNNPE